MWFFQLVRDYWTRTGSLYRPGQLAEITEDYRVYKRHRYMLILRRRFIAPKGSRERKWVYDGPIFEIRTGRDGTELVFFTNGLCFLQDGLQMVPDWEYVYQHGFLTTVVACRPFVR